MKEIKINFVDFWPSFNKTDNYFYNLLVKKYVILIDEKPDFLFYSCFGEEYLKFDCFRIFYTGENIRPDFSACDYAFSFDYNSRNNHFRLPLYSLYIDHCDMLDQLQTIVSREEARRIWRNKSKFCCMVISNPNCIKRIEFFENLSKVKLIDSGGAVLNNVGGRVADKFDFIKDYKFVISFENKEQEGYTTEKIMEPIFKDCIPIYWGNRLIDKDFNAKRFIDYNKFKSEKDLIDEMLKIDQNEELAIDIIMQPTFSLDKLSHEEEHQEVLRILVKIIENYKNPFGRKLWRHIQKFNIGYKKHKKRFLVKLKLV